MAAVALRGICKAFGERTILDHFDAEFETGSMTAIVGKSGSGKTTLLNIIGLIEKTDSGTVSICNVEEALPNTRASLGLLRNKIGYLFQNFALVDNQSVSYNLEIPLLYSGKRRKEKEKLKKDALQQVDLNCPLKQKIYELSGGEQQRVALARLLLKPCEIIIADEPTGSLDAMNRDKVLEILKEMNHPGKTIIIVTHDKFVAEQCPQQIQLS